MGKSGRGGGGDLAARIELDVGLRLIFFFDIFTSLGFMNRFGTSGFKDLLRPPSTESDSLKLLVLPFRLKSLL